MCHEIKSVNVAQMEVDLTTLKSKVQSLNSQHTALQLANTQLAAEKEEVVNILLYIIIYKTHYQ